MWFRYYKLLKNVDEVYVTDIVGVQIDTRSWIYGISAARVDKIWRATSSIICVGRASARQIIELVGDLVWFGLFRRPILSLLSLVFVWTCGTRSLLIWIWFVFLQTRSSRNLLTFLCFYLWALFI